MSKPPIGYLSSLLILAMDFMWGMAEIAATATVAGFPLVVVMMIGNFIVCGTGVMLLEKFTNEAKWGEAVAKGFFGGVIAGLPYPVIGPVFSLPALGWNILYSVSGSKDQNKLPPTSQR